ncbi:MAG: hypothetical protein KAR81_00250 [Sulfurimonas sp.]|nr:hypothetical protein [Sulfurimonas sp.]
MENKKAGSFALLKANSAKTTHIKSGIAIFIAMSFKEFILKYQSTLF